MSDGHDIVLVTVESEIVYKYFVTKITAHGRNKLQNLQMLN